MEEFCLLLLLLVEVTKAKSLKGAVSNTEDCIECAVSTMKKCIQCIVSNIGEYLESVVSNIV